MKDAENLLVIDNDPELMACYVELEETRAAFSAV